MHSGLFVVFNCPVVIRDKKSFLLSPVLLPTVSSLHEMDGDNVHRASCFTNSSAPLRRKYFVR